MIRGITFKSSQHQVPCIVILSILEYLVQNCVCVRAREHVCVIFILKVVFRKLSFIKYMGGIMLKEALLFFLFFFFFFFLDYVKYKYYRQQQFLQQKNRKNKEKKRRIKTIKTN